LITDWVDFMDLVMHATKNADLEKHRTNQKSTPSSISFHSVSKNEREKDIELLENEKGPVDHERERRGGKYIQYLF